MRSILERMDDDDDGAVIGDCGGDSNGEVKRKGEREQWSCRLEGGVCD